MLCQNCKRNEATTHIKQVINGDTAESHLCAECAASLGYADMFSGFGLGLGSLLGGFLGESVPATGSMTTVKRCPKCGSSFSDIAHSGAIGCAECYNLFYDRLLPSLQRIHGKTRHNGKSAPERVEAPRRTREDEIAALKEQLEKAVGEQRFEDAAKFRDEIKDMEAGSNE